MLCSYFTITLLTAAFLINCSLAFPPPYVRNQKDVAEILNNPQVARLMISRMNESELNSHYGQAFNDFIHTYGIRYLNNEERNIRLRIFAENMIKIEVLNEVDQGTAFYGVNKFSDMSSEEFSKKYTGLLPKSERSDFETSMEEAEIPDKEAPAEFDWRDHDAVTPVKNQGSCGSCYAFSVTGNIEGQVAIKRETLVALSEQEIVDCDTYDLGCDGGTLALTYLALQELGGLVSEDDYSYKGYKDECELETSKLKVKITGSVNISSSETDLAKWLAQNGPVSTSINAAFLQHYIGGIQYLPQFICDPDRLDHAVLLVGYGTKKTELEFVNIPYWIVKNSWNEDWGEEGYFRIFKGAGTCGINREPSSAIIE